MKLVSSTVLATLLVVSTFHAVSAGSCAGQIGPLTLSEDESTNNLYVMWTAPSGESGCTYTITYTSNAPNANTLTFETDDEKYVIPEEVLVPCSVATVSVRTSDGAERTAEATLETRNSTAPELLEMTTSCDSIEMTWEAQPYQENMCEHTHFQLFCLSDTHNFTVPQTVTDETHRTFHILLSTVLQPDVYYTCNGYMFVTLAGFTPPSDDIQFWSNLDTVRALEASETDTAIRASWEPPQNSEQCGVGYHVTYENDVLGTHSEETESTYIDLDAEIIPCTEYKISVTPISFTGSHGGIVSTTYEPEVTQGTVSNVVVDDNGNTLTVSWTPINIGKCNVMFVVNHYIDGDLNSSSETLDSAVELERVPCSDNRIEVSVVTNGNAGDIVTLDLTLSSSDIEEISTVQNLQVSGNVVSWEPPVSVGRCGVTYEIVHNSPFGSETNVVSGTEATLTLVPCSVNSVTIRGISDALMGTPATSEFTADAADLEAPENLRIIPDFTSATLTLRAEARTVNSCPITEALVTCSKDDSPDAFGDTIDVLDNEERLFELELSGLEEDSIYECSLRWSNSPMGNNFRFRTIPIPKNQLSVTDVTTEGFTVVWSEDYGEEFVKSYELVVNSHGPAHQVKDGCDHETGNTFVFELGAGTVNQLFVEGFPHFDYDITLTTTYNLGSLGVKAESDGLDTQTLSDVPGAPEALGVEYNYKPGEAYNVTGVITWAAPCELHGTLRSFGVKVVATFDLGGQEHTLDYSLDVKAESPNDVFTYELKDINPFFRYVISVHTLAASEGPSTQLVITPPDICSCVDV